MRDDSDSSPGKRSYGRSLTILQGMRFAPLPVGGTHTACGDAFGDTFVLVEPPDERVPPRASPHPNPTTARKTTRTTNRRTKQSYRGSGRTAGRPGRRTEKVGGRE
jgi:hypothetical protein